MNVLKINKALDITLGVINENKSKINKIVTNKSCSSNLRKYNFCGKT